MEGEHHLSRIDVNIILDKEIVELQIIGGVFKRFFYFFPDALHTHKDYLRNVKRLFGLVLEEYAHMAFVADSAIGVHLIITRFIRRHWRSNNYRRLP